MSFLASRVAFAPSGIGKSVPRREDVRLLTGKGRYAADFNLPMEAVREAIAYCESNPPEIREDWEAEEASVLASTRKKMNDLSRVTGAEVRLLVP